MKALTVESRKPETARVEDIPEPEAHGGSVLAQATAVGQRPFCDPRTARRWGLEIDRALHTWLAHLFTRRKPPAALAQQPDDIKVVVQFLEGRLGSTVACFTSVTCLSFI